MKFASDMFASLTPMRMVKGFAIAFVFWIGSLILTPFPHYLPPDFEYGFLSNKGAFFYSSGYFIGFYLHIAGAPAGLFLGGLQLSRSIRERYPSIHRRLGKLYVGIVLFAAAPGGLIMASKSYGGWSTHLCFAGIAVATWFCTWIGWRAARGCDFRRHQIWMIRSYLLMLSAVVLRLVHYLLQPLQLDHELTYQIAAWSSWSIPLFAYEGCRLARAGVISAGSRG